MSLSEENRRIIVSREIEKANANFMQAERVITIVLLMLREDLLNQCLPLQRK